MRWNCPHCEELVTAGIDFESTSKAYVRCAKCKGMALVHRSAVLADYVKARRLEEEAQLEAELNLKKVAALTVNVSANDAPEERPSPIEEILPEIIPTQNRATDEFPINPPREMSSPSPMAAPPVFEARKTPTPPAFTPFFDLTSGYDPIVETYSKDTVAAAPPVFTFPKPPAFLMNNAVESPSSSYEEKKPAPENATSEVRKSSTTAIWIAVTLAILSGAFLYFEGRRAFKEMTSGSILNSIME